MPKIHTLGPNTTDSYQAAQHLVTTDITYQAQAIELHPSFESIYQNLNTYSGDHLLVPVAYRSQNKNEDWTSHHYRCWQQLDVVKTFYLPTMPMVLLENKDNQNQQVILHPATLELLKSTLPQVDSNHLTYVTSKPLALKEFNKGDYQYAIASKTNTIKQENIIKEFTPKMIWCLYQIK